ncbi:MAG: tyrosine-type recombinase/integrase [Burkholderiales bacterium]|nr:tyrosine-type recombinase/integrase [Burkholderiales bacterium]
MLTDAARRNAKCPEGRAYQRHADSGGLYLEMTRSGAKLWRWKYRYAGKEKRLALGSYPDVSLAKARADRDAARKRLNAGADPSGERREAKAALMLESEAAFENVARRWWADWSAGKAERHTGYTLRRLEDEVFPVIGPRSVRGLDAPAFVRLAKAIEVRGAVDVARRVLQTCGQVMRYAVAHGLAQRNPVAEVKPGDFLQDRERVNFARIDVKDLPELMRKIASYSGSVQTRIALQVMAGTFVRTNELIGARWQEFDLDAGEWRVPAERTKSRREHFVPLSRQTVEALRCLQVANGGAERCAGAALLFPGQRDRSKPMSNNTLLKALERMGYKGRMTGHGFRGVASTALNEAGYRPDVIEAQLAHVEENRVRAAYNHARYVEERRELMQHWADYLDAVRQSDNVIPIRRQAWRAAA